jgi:hypothetical protein
VIVEVHLNVLEEELDVTPWVELGLKELEEYLKIHARFDEWLEEHNRT